MLQPARTMIDLDRLNQIALRPRPIGQLLTGWLFLTPNYSFPGRRTRIVVEGEEHLPTGGGAIFVMNHTDRYNYWPFQYRLWRLGRGHTATWVKGKYYESRALAWFMDWAGNIPMPSRGYLVTVDFRHAVGRVPSDAEYAALKRLADGTLDEAAARAEGGEAVARFLDGPWTDAPSGRWSDSIEARFAAMMRKVVDINRRALDVGLNLLVFPQGTRSVRLTPGHTGVAQIALHLRAPVIPVGCNGSDRLYPGNSPWSRGGTVVYRVGAPLLHDGELAPFSVDEPFVPFTREAERRHGAKFRGATDLMMARIEQLLDEPYRSAPNESPDGESSATGAKRFV
jgi:1-acyl-sn-glycerol-3-phosphate acyltransferase